MFIGLGFLVIRGRDGPLMDRKRYGFQAIGATNINRQIM